MTKYGEETVLAEGAGERTSDNQSQQADDSELLLTDDEEKQRYLNSCRTSGAKPAVRFFARTEGSFSMASSEEEPAAEDSDPPPAYTTSTTRQHGGGGSGSNRHDSRGRGSRKTVCRRLWKLVRSLGGQAALLIAYTFLGAWVMMTLEGPREDAQKQQVRTGRDRIAAQLKNHSLALKAGLINETEWDHYAHSALLEFESRVHTSGLSSTSKKKWTFFGSVLFCFTTYTTIGYGNIAPATKAGRIATMLYATLGIPLALIILADLGRRFALAFKFLWGFVRRYYYTGYCRRVRDKANKTSYDMNHSPAAVGDCERGDQDIRRQGSYRKVDRSANRVDAGYRQETEGGTAGAGGDGDGGGTSSDRKKTGGELTTEADPTRSQTGPVSETHQHTLQDVDAVDQPGKSEIPVTGSRQGEDTGAGDEHHQQDTLTRRPSTADDTDLQEDFKLPVPVAIGFIFAYIFLGAGMYILWEDWTYLESFYFVFITTSTIGFGDVLPEHPNFFLLSCVYTFLGLAFVSMTVNVIMDFMTKTIHLAKHSVDSAKARVVAKASAVRGIVTHVGSRAKHKVRKTFTAHKKKTKKAKRSSKGIEVGERSERSDSDSERKTRKAKRSSVVKGMEVGERSQHGDSDSDRADIPKVYVTDTAFTVREQPRSDSATANDVKPHSHTGQKNGGHLVPSDGSVSPSVDSNTSNGYNTCEDGL